MASKPKTVELGEICTFTQGVQVPDKDILREPIYGYIRYLYIQDFKDEGRKAYVKNIYGNKIVRKDHIIMANTGATAGCVFRGTDGVLSNNAGQAHIN